MKLNKFKSRMDEEKIPKDVQKIMIDNYIKIINSKEFKAELSILIN